MGEALKMHSSTFQDFKDYSHEMSRDLAGSKVEDLIEEESKGELVGDLGSEESQALDPLRIHFQMQEDALKAKKVR